MLAQAIYFTLAAIALLIALRPSTSRYTLETSHTPGGFRTVAYYRGATVSVCYHRDNATSRELALASAKQKMEQRHPIA